MGYRIIESLKHWVIEVSDHSVIESFCHEAMTPICNESIVNFEVARRYTISHQLLFLRTISAIYFKPLAPGLG